MTAAATAVPLPDISGLSQYIEKWGTCATMRARMEERCVTPFPQLEAFHTAILPVLEQLVDFLDQFPPDDLPEEYIPLANTVRLLAKSIKLSRFGAHRCCEMHSIRDALSISAARWIGIWSRTSACCLQAPRYYPAIAGSPQFTWK